MSKASVRDSGLSGTSVLNPELREFLKGKDLFVSFSGGSDSLALLSFFIEERNASPDFFHLHAVHFEHGFRGKASIEDAEFCRDFCQKHAIDFQCLSLNVPARKGRKEGDEDAARRLRLDAWQHLIPKSARKSSVIVLGHHADDRIENLLIRLFRGSNASGLSSLRSIQTINGLLFFRPFLNISKKEILHFLQEKGISVWREDASNQTAVYRRNFLRNELIPLLEKEIPHACGGMIRAFHALESDAIYLEDIATKEYERLRTIACSGQILPDAAPDDCSPNAVLPLEEFRALPRAILIRVLRLFLREHAPCEIIPDSSLILRLEEEMEKKTGKLRRIPIASSLNDDSSSDLKQKKERSGNLPRFSLLLDGKTIFFHEEKHDMEGNNDHSFLKEAQSILWHWQECPVCELAKQRFKAERIGQEEFKRLLQEYSNSPERAAEQVFFDEAALTDSSLFQIRFRKEGDRMIPFGKRNPQPLKKLFIDAKIPVSLRDRLPLLLDANANEILWLPKIRTSAIAPVTENTKKILRITILPCGSE